MLLLASGRRVLEHNKRIALLTASFVTKGRCEEVVVVIDGR